MIGPSHQCGHALYEADAAGNVEGSVAVAITHERIGICLEEVLDHLLLACEYSKMQGRLGRVIVVLEQSMNIVIN